MKVIILLVIEVAVFVAGTEAHLHVCTPYDCARYCVSKGCTLYRCGILHPNRICFCFHCTRMKSPFRATQQDAKSMNALDYTPVMKSMENLDNGMDML